MHRLLQKNASQYDPINNAAAEQDMRLSNTYIFCYFYASIEYVSEYECFASHKHNSIIIHQVRMENKQRFEINNDL